MLAQRRTNVAADIKRIEAEVYSLSSRERARLAMNLIKSLDDHDDADAEELWLQEAERRYRDYREGKLKTRPAEDVLRDAFSKVR
jgi:putative addiction module component (TIGR02574 family)